MSRTVVERCAVCGGPLEGIAGQVIVACPYCGSENRLVTREHEHALARNARLIAAANEARQLAGDLEARAEAQHAAYVDASERAMRDHDPHAGAAALRHLEGWLRLQYAPTLHMFQAMPPDDPTVVAALAQIDAVIDRALTTAAQQLGAPYRTTRERLGGGCAAPW